MLKNIVYVALSLSLIACDNQNLSCFSGTNWVWCQTVDDDDDSHDASSHRHWKDNDDASLSCSTSDAGTLMDASLENDSSDNNEASPDSSADANLSDIMTDASTTDDVMDSSDNDDGGEFVFDAGMDENDVNNNDADIGVDAS